MGLHFEACYYQGIEYCIENKLTVFEPGAQGEHKVVRGFIPTLTRSAHYLMQDHFKESINHFIEYEKNNVMAYIKDVNKHIPYKKLIMNYRLIIEFYYGRKKQFNTWNIN